MPINPTHRHTWPINHTHKPISTSWEDRRPHTFLNNSGKRRPAYAVAKIIDYAFVA